MKPAINITATVKMQSVRPFIMCLQISRCISSSSVCSNINKQSKFMKKIMHGSRKPKKKWYDTNTDLRSIASVNSTDKSPSAHTRRRMMIRDRLFMEHITDMMSTGEVTDIIKDSVEITHVKITPDFTYVNVFYIPSNDDISPVDQEALQRCARIIRHELSQLRVIGVVPPIQFVQNKQYFTGKEVERRLATINFEKDSEILAEQMQLEPTADHDSETDEFYTRLPVMRHDVLGLDHHKIMSRICSAVSKSKKAAQRRILDANINTDESSHDSKEVEFLTREEQRKIFTEFLSKRRREEKRKYNLRRSHKLLNSFEEEIDIEESDESDKNYENDIDMRIGEHVDDFEDETRK